jgi:hypothetical protein
MGAQYGILEEKDEGQDLRFYIYNFDEEDTVHWFDTYDEANQFLEWLNGRVE